MEGRGVSGIKVTDLEEDAGLESVPVLLDGFRGEGGRSVRDRFVVLVRPEPDGEMRMRGDRNNHINWVGMADILVWFTSMGSSLIQQKTSTNGIFLRFVAFQDLL